MSDALPLPPRPNLEQYKKLARDFQHACKSQNADAIRECALKWVEKLSWLERVQTTSDAQRTIAQEAAKIERLWHKLQKTSVRAGRCTLAGFQLLVARSHGFASWPKFSRHLKELSSRNSPVSQFETAVDAIVSGDSAALGQLLRENPDLVRMRSNREHRSTLLHYVSANGVEDFRQKTPRNIVEIAKMLLEAGAQVNAESEAYGGHSTTLGLTATSWHPENAGVQIPLLEVLIGHGAAIESADGGAVVACLANGRKQAAEFLAAHGARLDLEAAAGVGRLDVVKSFFDHDGSLKPTATQNQMKDAFTWACEFGRTEIVDFLLRHGVPIEAKLRHHGQTGLHWACYGGYADTVRLLLERGAPVEVKDDAFGGTPLGWALYAWNNSPGGANHDGYHHVVSLLVNAGAKLDREWLAEDPDRPQLEKLRADKKLAAVLKEQLA